MAAGERSERSEPSERGERRVGLAYTPAFLDHDPGPFHPERPDRLRAILDGLERGGTLQRLLAFEPEPVPDEMLGLVHTTPHIESVRNIVQRGGGHLDLDTVASSGSLDAALRAVGGVVEAAQRVSDNTLDAAFCAVRPPGHHATPHQAMGFCLFNNVAVATAWLLHTGRAKRVAILDYDVHHGNGTQDIFWARSDVLYVSTHQYPFYPGTGYWQEAGSGDGLGYTVNVTLPPGGGDTVYLAALEQLVEPIARRYEPDFVFVSLGLDAFWHDPLAQMRLTVSGYTRLVQSAMRLSAGRLVVALEGGYNLDALALGADSICRVLLGAEPPEDTLGGPRRELAPHAVEPLFRELRKLHRLS